MTDDLDALRAERDALRAERDALAALLNPATKMWTAIEIGSLTHAEYKAVEQELHAALREGRVKTSEASAARDPFPESFRRLRVPETSEG